MKEAIPLTDGYKLDHRRQYPVGHQESHTITSYQMIEQDLSVHLISYQMSFH
nr:MAG TPA: protein of unknown function (DUF5598) [Crassvirales sp.]